MTNEVNVVWPFMYLWTFDPLLHAKFMHLVHPYNGLFSMNTVCTLCAKSNNYTYFLINHENSKCFNLTNFFFLEKTLIPWIVVFKYYVPTVRANFYPHFFFVFQMANFFFFFYASNGAFFPHVLLFFQFSAICPLKRVMKHFFYTQQRQIFGVLFTDVCKLANDWLQLYASFFFFF